MKNLRAHHARDCPDRYWKLEAGWEFCNENGVRQRHRKGESMRGYLGRSYRWFYVSCDGCGRAGMVRDGYLADLLNAASAAKRAFTKEEA